MCRLDSTLETVNNNNKKSVYCKTDHENYPYKKSGGEVRLNTDMTNFLIVYSLGYHPLKLFFECVAMINIL